MSRKYLDKIVNEWSYKVGAIDPKNKEHLYQLEKILIQNGWYEDVISEVSSNLLNEAATNRTEDLHEIFFAVAFAGGNMSKAKNLDGMIKMINKLSMLDKKKLHIAKEGLKVISSNGLDKYDVASKTLDEINNI